MNKKFSKGLLAICFLHISLIFCFAQDLNISLKISSPNSPVVDVKGEFTSDKSEKNLLFLLSYADSDNLGARIENVELFDEANQKVNFRKVADGTFAAEKSFRSFAYRVNAVVPANILSTAHISWLSNEKGILRPNDLLPDFETKYETALAVELPVGWKISTSEKLSARNIYALKDFENSIFVVGKNWSEYAFTVSDINVELILDDEQKIEKPAAEKIVKDILLKYANDFGAIPGKNLRIVNFKFPSDAGFDRWRAETFGGNVLIMSARTTFESQTQQRFREQLRHELFHLWMPNDLALDGNYSWFYEGFAQYAALRTGVELNQISFSDFLNTLEQAYNIANRRSQPISLIDASKNRWLGENSSVYAKGLAIAFLFDVALLQKSSGRRGVISFLREFYGKHKNPNKSENGNAAILKLSANFAELSPIIEDYVKGSKKLDFEGKLEQTGIEIKPNGSSIKLQTKAKLNGREKDFLNKLGYNNWRKFL